MVKGMSSSNIESNTRFASEKRYYLLPAQSRAYIVALTAGLEDEHLQDPQ